MTPTISLNGRNYIIDKERINPCHVLSVINKNIHMFSIGDDIVALNLQPRLKSYNATVTECLAQMFKMFSFMN